MKVYFNEKGHIKNVVYDNITATSHISEKIEAYADFDTSAYTVTIDILRTDGMMLGRYPMLPVVENDEVHHEYVFTKDDVAIPGSLQMTIRYEIYQENDEGELEVVYSKPMGLVVMQVYEAIDISSDKYQIIDRRFFENELKIQTNKIDIENLELNKVEKAEGKILSSNDFTDDYITQIGFSVRYIRRYQDGRLEYELHNGNRAINPDYILSKEQYDKLANIEEKAQVNKVEKILVNGDEQIPDENKTVNISVKSGGDENVIEKILVNNIEQTPVDKTVNIPVPTKTSVLTNDTGFITQDDIPAIPTSFSELFDDIGYAKNEDIPTKASDVGALPGTTKYGFTLSGTYDGLTGEITVNLNDQDGNILSSKIFDLPLELLIATSGSYYDNGIIYLKLANGEYIQVDVAELIDSYTADGTTIVMTDRQFGLSQNYKNKIDDLDIGVRSCFQSARITSSNGLLFNRYDGSDFDITGEARVLTPAQYEKFLIISNPTIEIDDDVEAT